MDEHVRKIIVLRQWEMSYLSTIVTPHPVCSKGDDHDSDDVDTIPAFLLLIYTVAEFNAKCTTEQNLFLLQLQKYEQIWKYLFVNLAEYFSA